METTLLELASAFSEALQDETMASRLLAALIRSGAVRNADGALLEISPEADCRAYALGGEPEEEIAPLARREIPGTDPRRAESPPRRAPGSDGCRDEPLDQQGERA